MSQAKPDKPITPTQAWQPFTPRGVAAYALTSGTRLFLVQCLVAIIVALTCVWFVALQWAPIVTRAIENFPGSSVIQQGVWTTTNSQPRLLAGNRYLEIILDARNVGGVSGAADVSAIVTVPALRLCGVLGCMTVPYEPDYKFTLTRPELTAWWDAWRRPIESLLGVTVALSVLVSWWLLAIIATPVVKLIAFFADRQVTWGGAWRMANAALLAGAFIVVVGILSYGIGLVDPLRLGLIYALHIVADVALIATSPFFLPKIPKLGRNPFSTSEPAPANPTPKDKNPFS